ncbi:MAG: hypothetical protein QE276_07475 [Cyanobium sp. D14.bin.5]|nr:hypothetical protein [Cyanobium sp. D14.bin.5]
MSPISPNDVDFENRPGSIQGQCLERTHFTEAGVVDQRIERTHLGCELLSELAA